MASKRYIPQSATSFLREQLNLSKVQTLKNTLRDTSYHVDYAVGGQLHPEVYGDVKYTPKPVLTTPSRVLSKYENKNPLINNIALYDTKGQYELNATNVPGLGQNQLLTKLLDNARDRVEQKESWRVPMTFIPIQNEGGNVMGLQSFNPRLPITETNMIPTDNKPVLVDERMIWHTFDRPYLSKGDQEDLAIQIQANNNPIIRERNARQKEMEDVARRRHKTAKWSENYAAYWARPQPILYEKDKENYVARTQLQESIGKLSYPKERVPLDLTHTNQIKTDIENARFKHDYDRQLDRIEYNAQYGERIGQYEDIEGESDKKPKGFMTNIVNAVSSPIKKFLGIKYKPDVSLPERALIAEDESPEDIAPINSIETDKPFKSEERFLYKDTHMLVTRTGELEDYYPDEMPSDAAISYLTTDATTNNMVRQNVAIVKIANSVDPKLVVMHKRNQAEIFANDGKPISNDLIVYEVPIQTDDPTVRKIYDKASKTGRDGLIPLTYEEQVTLYNLVQDHPDKQTRVNSEYLRPLIDPRDGDVNNFEPSNEFIDYEVYATPEVREKAKSNKTDNRVDNMMTQKLEDEIQHELSKYQTPEAPTKINRSANESFITNSRNTGVKRGKFDL